MAQREKEPLPLLQVGVGTMVSSMSISGLVLGYFTDLYVGTIPVFMILFGFLGVLGGIMKAHKMLIAVPESQRAKAEQRNRPKH